MNHGPRFMLGIRNSATASMGASEATTWVFLAGIAPSMDITPAQSAAFFGQLHVGFVLLAVSGILGIFNGIRMVRANRINPVLTIGALLIAGAAMYVLWSATKVLPS
jgi:hypothetical protein